MSSESLISSTGPMLVGVALEWGLLGILGLQVFTFYTSSTKERLGIKILVYTLFTLSITHSIIAFTWAWRFLISGWGNPDVFVIVPWQAGAHTILSGIMAMLEQLFFCWRLWAFNSKKILIRCVVTLVIMISLMQMVASLYGGIRAAQSATIADIEKLNKIARVWLSGGFSGDILVATSMIIVLRYATNDAYSRRTQIVLQKLIVRSVETGSVTAIAALIVLVLFELFDTNYIYIAAAFLLCNLYSNVVLASINGRKSIASILTQGNTTLGYTSGRNDFAPSHELAFHRQAQATIDQLDTTSIKSASDPGQLDSPVNTKTAWDRVQVSRAPHEVQTV
ncbi:hypothetical protein EV361DRAFT_929701 [Lentinula raphanica]|uniref:DUF6534 domain-containing protein n=1 Tax=Lentinula raphanica TaxID=153919 RepID=A0AA38P5U4_9AGAR|nr:hypothetical protein C8R42DRAFT_113207 [Lentinula raphanica]KAJ3762009.1 hypothetical protein EV360DRAFT_79729 [Lentinula raphanica]KAJ3773880.1 hypothetical protein FB446DRAFT_730964 [Lentinula raphanica]KAJ3822781.1 hypothetical protein F5880DRAFT_1572134 [Lentinula raphanica]KAJ3836680.1 hypothetical protein F5878DRAFT_662767 [Lentinula raphanica]